MVTQFRVQKNLAKLFQIYKTVTVSFNKCHRVQSNLRISKSRNVRKKFLLGEIAFKRMLCTVVLYNVMLCTNVALYQLSIKTILLLDKLLIREFDCKLIFFLDN